VSSPVFPSIFGARLSSLLVVVEMAPNEPTLIVYAPPQSLLFPARSSVLALPSL